MSNCFLEFPSFETEIVARDKPGRQAFPERKNRGRWMEWCMGRLRVLQVQCFLDEGEEIGAVWREGGGGGFAGEGGEHFGVDEG